MKRLLRLANTYFLLVLYVVAASIFLVHYAVSGQAVYGDGIGYYAHLHSWVIDGDWNYTNEYRHIYSPGNNNLLRPKISPTIQIVATTPQGQAENHYSPGVAVVLLPVYLVAHILSLGLNLIGWFVPVHGYAHLYQILSGLGAVGYVVFGLWLIDQLLAKYGHELFVRRLAVVGIFLATPLLYYGSFDVINSHFAAFFLSSLFFYSLVVLPEDRFKHIGLGMIVGLMAVNRPQDGAASLVWICSQWQLWRHTRNQQAASSLKDFFYWLLPYGLAFGLGLSISLLPLAMHWLHVFGNPLHHTYLRSLVIDYHRHALFNPWGSLTNLRTGLARTPLLLLLLGFYFWQLKRRQGQKYWLWIVFFVSQYLIVTIQGGWQAAAYGGRMYLSTLPFFAMLLADVCAVSQKHQSLRLVIVLISCLSILNVVALSHFVLMEKGTEGGGRGTEQRTLKRLQRYWPALNSGVTE